MKDTAAIRVVPQVRDDVYWDEGNEDEMQFWPRAVWLDPGGTSGLGVVWFHPGLIVNKEVPLVRSVLAWWGGYLHGNENQQAKDVLDVVKLLGGEQGLAVGIEDFQLRTDNRSEDVLSPVRITARVEFGLWRGLKEHDGVVRRRAYAKQQPVDAKRVITDDRLKMWDMYTPGPDHIRDATRHALLWCRRLRNQGSTFLHRTHGYDKDWYQ